MSDIWSDLETFADKEDRIGRRTFVVTEKKTGTSEYGPWYSFRGTLNEASGSRCSMFLNKEPTEDDARAAMGSGDKRKANGIRYEKRKHVGLAKYGKSVDTLDVGDELKVVTKFEKSKDGNKFVVVDEVLAPNEELEQVVQTSAAGGPGF
jgi:hypothetical protein